MNDSPHVSPFETICKVNETGKLILNNVVVVENLNAQLAKLSYQTRYSPA